MSLKEKPTAPIEAVASFPEGHHGIRGTTFASQAEINAILVGRTISGVKLHDHCRITFILDDGRSVTVEPQGMDGDDLSLTINQGNL